MKLSEMRRYLDERNIQLTKSLGQNFLHDANQLQRIVELAALKKSDKVLEIGPGLGPLTELLIEHASELLAIEKDRRLVEVLEERLGSCTNLRIHSGDALAFLQREKRDWSDWKVVSNLPYSVASPLLVELTSALAGPISMIVTLQLEVARRLTAKAGDDDYGILTLLIQPNYEPEICYKIPPTCFFPPPSIESACLSLRRRTEPLVPPSLRRTFERIIKRAFSERRKMMMKLLKFDWPPVQVEAAFAELNIDPSVRAEKVSLSTFALLAALLSSSR